MTRDARSWLRYLAGHLAMGTVAAMASVSALLATDAAGLARLAFADADGGVAIGLLAFGIWVTFGSLAMGAGIMGISRASRAGRGLGGSSAGPLPASVRPRSGSRSSR